MGWPVALVERRQHGDIAGETFFGDAPEGDAKDLAHTRAVVAILPAIDDPGGHGCSEDLNFCDLMVRLGGLRLSDVVRDANALLATPEFRRQVRAVELQLHSAVFITAQQLREIVQ